MTLLSIKYAVFVAVALVLYQLCPSKYRPVFLSTTSFVLYSFYSFLSALILLAAVVLTFSSAKKIEQAQSLKRKRTILAIAITALAAYLIFVKVLPILYGAGTLPFIRLIVALGVSYYTFKLIGYLVDVYWNKYPAWANLIDFSAFVAFFPQLPAGPIQRANEFSLQPAQGQSAELMKHGLRRILLGYVKKVAVADQLGALVAYVISIQPQYSNLNWVIAYIYAIQLYADFSALTDISIGTASLFGLSSPENFFFPFFSSNISEFWRRWHMSLTRWLTDYVFTPLRMATRNLGALGLAMSVTVNMVLIGLWHGIGFGFVLFGLLNALFLIVDALTIQRRRRWYKTHPGADRFTDLVGPIVTFHLVVFALVFFRANSAVYAFRHLCDGLLTPMAGLRTLMYGYGQFRSLCTFVGLGVFIAVEVMLYLRASNWRRISSLPSFTGLPRPARWVVYYAGLVVAAAMHQQAAQFIYVQF